MRFSLHEFLNAGKIGVATCSASLTGMSRRRDWARCSSLPLTWFSTPKTPSNPTSFSSLRRTRVSFNAAPFSELLICWSKLISPSSVRRDRYEKKDLYARFGVKEYWIGDPANKALEILTLKAGRYELHCCAEEKGKLASLVLAGLEFDLSDIQ